MVNRRETEETRTARIGRVLESVIAHSTAGGVVDWNALQSEHSDLMPELADSLRTLRDIQAAAARARHPSAPDDPDTGHGSDMCLRVLRQQLPQYADFERVRAGGQGVVYRARHRETSREVAIKVLGIAHSGSSKAVQRIIREAELTSRFTHPNIVTLYESGVADGVPYCVLEFIHGLPIDLYVNMNDVEPRAVAQMFVTVCRAIGYAHKRGVIHRDLKPSNILIDSDGQPHILDFGLAKDFGDRGSGLTQSMDFLGTLAYCSPEHLQPHADAVDVQSDIYSLGVVLYELLTGTTPYPTSGSYQETIRNVLSRDPTPIASAVQRQKAASATESGIEPDLAAITLKALSKEKPARYAWADAMADDLERYLRGEAVVARAASRFYVLRKTLRRHRVAVTLGAVVLVAVTGASIVFASLWRTTRTERDRARNAATLASDVFHTVLGEVNESVATLAGGTAVRDALTSTIVSKLDRLRDVAEADTSMESLWLASQDALGNIALSRGDADGAIAEFRRMLESAEAGLVASPQNPELVMASCKALHGIGLASGDVTRYAEAAGRLRELNKRRPNDEEAQFLLARVYADHAAAALAASNRKTAVELAQAGLDISDRHSDKKSNDSWMDLFLRLASIETYALRGLGDLSAEGKIDNILSRREEIFNQQPANVLNRLALVRTYLHVGDRHDAARQAEQAMTAYRHACLHGEYLIAADPSHPDFANSCADALVRLADRLLRIGQLVESRAFAERSAALAESWLQREPDSASWLRRRADSVRILGAAYVKSKDYEVAATHLHRSIELLELLLSLHPDDDVSRDNLGYVYLVVAWMCHQQNAPEPEHENLVHAHRIRTEMVDAFNDNNEYLLKLAEVEIALGKWYIDHAHRENRATIERHLSEAERHLDAVALRASEYHAASIADWRSRLGALRSRLSPN